MIVCMYMCSLRAGADPPIAKVLCLGSASTLFGLEHSGVHVCTYVIMYVCTYVCMYDCMYVNKLPASWGRSPYCQSALFWHGIHSVWAGTFRYVCTYVFVCQYVHMMCVSRVVRQMYMYVCICIPMYTYIHIYTHNIYTHTYIHIYIQTIHTNIHTYIPQM